MSRAHDAATGGKSDIVLGDGALRVRLGVRVSDSRVVGHEEVVGGFRAKALLAVPGHVVDGHERTVCQQQEVEQAAADDDIVSRFDHAGQGGVGRRLGHVVSEAERVVTADCVVDRAGVQGCLYGAVVEVVVGAGALGGEAEFVP